MGMGLDIHYNRFGIVSVTKSCASCHEPSMLSRLVPRRVPPRARGFVGRSGGVGRKGGSGGEKFGSARPPPPKNKLVPVKPKYNPNEKTGREVMEIEPPSRPFTVSFFALGALGIVGGAVLWVISYNDWKQKNKPSEVNQNDISCTVSSVLPGAHELDPIRGSRGSDAVCSHGSMRRGALQQHPLVP